MNSVELLTALDEMIFDGSRKINHDEQIEFLIRWTCTDLTIDKLNSIKNNLNPKQINMYGENEIAKLSGEYYIGLVFDV